MKKTGQAAIDFCSSPPNALRCALLFGEDTGLVECLAQDLLARWIPQADPMNIIRLSDEDLRKNPDILEDQLCARSLMGGETLVRVKTDKDTSQKVLIEALKKIEGGRLFQEAFWIIEAGDLTRNSKLRTAFEDSGIAIALELSPDGEAEINDLVSRHLDSAGIELEPDAKAAFCSELAGNRRLALSELEKLSLYAINLDRSVTLTDIRSFASGEIVRGADDAADAAILGDIRACENAIDRFLDSGGSPITALRILHLRLMRVSNAQATRASNGFRLWPPVPTSEWPAFSKALKDWTPAMVLSAFQMLYRTEASCKSAGSPADALVRQAIRTVAARTLGHA